MWDNLCVFLSLSDPLTEKLSRIIIFLLDYYKLNSSPSSLSHYYFTPNLLKISCQINYFTNSLSPSTNELFFSCVHTSSLIPISDQFVLFLSRLRCPHDLFSLSHIFLRFFYLTLYARRALQQNSSFPTTFVTCHNWPGFCTMLVKN